MSRRVGRLAGVLGLVILTTVVQAPAPAIGSAPAALFDRVPATSLGNDRSVFAHVVTSGDGVFHSVVRQDTVLAQQILYRTSRDGGRTWQFNAAFSGSSGSGATKPVISVDGKNVAIAFVGTLCVTFNTCLPTPHLTVSNDQGVSWSPVRRLSDAETTSVTVAQDGNRTWMAWDRLDGGPTQLRSTLDGGATFGTEQQFQGLSMPMLSADRGIAALGGVSPNGSSVVLASPSTAGPVRLLPGRLVGLASADGQVHAALLGDRFAVSTAEATNPSAQWGAPVVVGEGRPSQATIDARPGLVAVGWSDYESTARSRRAQSFVSSSTDGGGSFTVPVSVGANPDGIALSTLVSVARTTTDGPIARFDWDVPDRYIDGDDPDRLRDPANPTNVPELDRILVDVIDIDVHLDGCGSVATAPGTSIIDYTWIVDGVTLPEHTCEVTASMRDAVASDVVLEVSDSTGATGRNSLAVTPQDLLIVSIGDSVASGEGNPHIATEFGLLNLAGSLFAGTTGPAWTPEKWQDDPCHRSAYSGPALAAQQIEDADPRTSVTFVQLSCSGAAIMDVPSSPGALPPDADADTGGVLDPYHGVEPYGIDPRPSQLDQLQALRGARPVDAVFVSIGANDVKFSEVVTQCLTKTADTLASCDTSSTKTNLDTRLGDLPRRYAALASRLASIGVAPSDVYVTEYFDQTDDEYGRANLRCAAEGVGLFAGIAATAIDPILGALALAVLSEGLITDDEATWAKNYVGPKLNEAVRTAATTHGWRYVGGIASAFARHGYCSSDPWVVSLSESVTAQGDINGAFHPNRAGHVAYGDAIARAYANDHLPTTTAGSDVLSGSERHGDVYALVAGPRAVTAVSLRDTGSTLLPLGARRLVSILPATSGDSHSATPISPVAASATAATATWNEGWESWRWYQAWAAPVTVVEDVTVTGVTLSQAPAIATKALAAHPTYVLAAVRAELSMPRELAVRVQVDDGEGSVIDTTTDVLVRSGQATYVLPLDTPIELRSGTATATVTVNDPPGAGAAAAANNTAISPPVEVRAGREALVTIMPTITTDGSSVTCGQAAAAASSQGRYATAAIPALEVEVELDCTAPAPITPDTGGVLRALVELDQYAQLTGRDAVVGIVPSGWLQRVSGQAIGITGFDLRGILVEAGSAPSTLSHELAHTLGVDHTNGGRAIGINTSTRSIVDGTDWMFFRSVRPDWTSGPVWDAMLLGLGGPDARPTPPDFTDGSVFIRGAVYQNESGAWEYSPGRWSTGGTGEPPPLDLSELEVERLVARQTDTDTGAVTETPVPLAPVEAKLGPNGTIGDLQQLGLVASWPVEIDAASDRIDILLDDQIVETRGISPGDPMVEVTAPAAGTSVTRGEPFEVTWTSSDPDGDPLTFDLLISGDGGTTWEPLASAVSGSSTTVTAPADQGGDAIVLRVIASDGIRQGADDSDPFSITFVDRGPEQVFFERIGRNVDGNCAAFTANCKLGLGVMSPDGTDERQFIEFEPPVADIIAPTPVTPLTRAWAPANPAVSPDGRTVAFQIQWENAQFRSVWDTDQVGIAVADHDGSGRRLITPALKIPGETSRWLSITCPSWSPDGTRLAALGYAESGNSGPARTYVLTMAPDGSDLRLAGVHQWWGTRTACPSWSPDGTRLVLAVARTAYDNPSYWPVDMPPLDPDTKWTLLSWDATGSTAPVGQLVGFVARDIDPTTDQRIDEVAAVGTVLEEATGSFLVSQFSSRLCGIVRIFPGGAGQERVMTCPRTRIVVATDPPGVSRGFVVGYNPPHIQTAPDGRLAITSGDQFVYATVGIFGGYAPSLCTIPGDSLAEPLTQASLGNDFMPPGHLCVTGPGTTSPSPSYDTAFGQLHHAWSAGAVLDGPGSGLVSIPPAAPAPLADPGGPYAAVVGAPIIIDAGASARLVGDDGTALVEWDLDGDDEFDDAVGTRPTVTFEQPGSFQVRVRITVGAGPAVVSEPTSADINAAPDVAVVASPDISEPGGTIPEPADQTITVPAGIVTLVGLELAGGGSTAFQIVGSPDPADISITVPGGAGPEVDGLVTGPDGRVAVTPDAGFAGVGTATFRVAGAEGPTATLTIEVVAPPAPIAGPDNLTVTAGVLAVVDPADLLGNDASASAAPSSVATRAQQLGGLRIIGVNGADNGVAWLDLNGMVNVLARTPGVGSFRYTVADGAMIADGAVSLVVNAPNAPTTDPPTTAAPPPPRTDATPTTVMSPLPESPPQPAPPTQPPLATELPATGSEIGRPLRMATVLVLTGLAAIVIVHTRRRSPGLRD